VALADLLRIVGPHVATIQKVVPEAYVAETFEQALDMARQTAAPVATLEGDVFRGARVLSGGTRVESRGILATRREIKELRERVAADRESLGRLVEEARRCEIAIAHLTDDIAAFGVEQHRHEMAIVGFEAQIARAAEDAVRLARKGDVIGLERRAAEEEQRSLDARLAEAQVSVGRLLEEQRQAEDQLSAAQKRLMVARDASEALSARAAEAKAAHAALVERTSALAAEVIRLEEGARELEQRIATRASELEQAMAQRDSLQLAIVEGEQTLDNDVRALEELRETLRTADDTASELRVRVDAHDGLIREARRALDAIRAEAGECELARATAQSDLTHLAQSCLEATQSALDQVLVEVEQMEQAGETTPDAAAIHAEEPESEEEVGETPAPIVVPASLTAEEAIVALKAKIDRLGPVNMMAIEQFDELETRHAFLTTQRKDLVDSIAQTSEAIKRIDETSTTRFNEAFTAIQQNFQQTFSTLFGGGRAGLTLLDENDPLESGIDIVASPPGKRLQSVQLLSGGEKALTAIALMFAIFKYKPSPFCLLDEIDAPLDDANVGRFVEMLQGMLGRTQFILITHNRRTMEIANRLYGVTMEEPGVSKLISVQLN
jgi:chromosome segregation protein